jgi:hypothetical protein
MGDIGGAAGALVAAFLTAEGSTPAREINGLAFKMGGAAAVNTVEIQWAGRAAGARC